MNMKENDYVYQFRLLNEVTEAQKRIKENDNENSMFDIVIRHEYTPTNKDINTLHSTRQNSVSKHTKRKQPDITTIQAGTHKINLDKFRGVRKYSENIQPII
jgi:hypothetical protein